MHQKRFWPDPDQLLLLHLCLQRDAGKALAAWEQWKKRVDLDDLDHASFRIISLACSRLVSLGVDDPDMGRIKGIYRYQWTKNKLAFRGKAELLHAFADASIPTLLLKGAALCQTVYPDPTARAMHDLDLLVRVSDAARVVRLLQDRGWTPQHFAPETIIQYLHACSFLHPRYGELDLHWHVMRSHCDTESDAGLWAAAVAHTFEGAPTQILCPADQFLHACEHGMHHSPTSSLQWLVDACFILRHSATPMDWERLLGQTRRFQLALPVRKTLSYLRQHFAEPVPDGVLQQLSRSPVDLCARVEYFLAGRPENKQQDFLQRTGLLLCHYLRLSRNRPLREIIRGFPLYVRLVHHCDRGVGRLLLDALHAVILFLGMKLRDGLLLWHRWSAGHPLPAVRRLADFRDHEMRDFHRTETILGQPFRWSEPEASLSVPLPPGDCTLIWEIPAFCRPGDLLQRQPAFSLNGRPLAVEKAPWTHRGMLLRIPGSFLKPGPGQTLSWSLPAFHPAGKDSRALGLPFSRLWICPDTPPQ